ncbi:E3 ubiquitin-protein ligase [Nymphaea thermarum]|nr:E3 ubiquitin-protein ligase [Nymphaea thermarum]
MEIEVVEASPSVVVKDEEARCPVCLEGFGADGEAREMPCNHRYHEGCINKWLEKHNTCPYVGLRCRWKKTLSLNTISSSRFVLFHRHLKPTKRAGLVLLQSLVYAAFMVPMSAGRFSRLPICAKPLQAHRAPSLLILHDHACRRLHSFIKGG